MESQRIDQTTDVKNTEILKKRTIGLAIGSGGVYACAGLGVFATLKENGLDIQHLAGASGGAIIAALCYLEGDPGLAKEKFLQKLPLIQNIKLSSVGKPMSGANVKEIIEDALDGRNWVDGKLESVCFGAAYQDNNETVILTKNSGLSLADCVQASISLKMIEPIVKSTDGRIIAHGGDPDYIRGLRLIGADFIIDVSPNLETGIIGGLARTVNTVSSAIILKGDYFAGQKIRKSDENKSDFAIHPNLSLKPLVSPLNFSRKNVDYMIEKGKILTEQSMPRLKESLLRKF